MKILFFEPAGLVTPHWETALELMELHLQKGDQVIMLGCDSSIPACYNNLYHIPRECLSCLERRAQGLALLSQNVEQQNLISLTKDDYEMLDGLPHGFDTVADLKNYRIENLDLGYAALSTLVSSIRDPEPDLAVHRETVLGLLKGCLTAYLSMRNHIEAHRPDRVYLFNGRFDMQRGALRACQRAGVDVYAHERGSRLDRYMLFENKLPHDIEAQLKLVDAYWQATPEDERVANADAFFNARAQGKVLAWKSYITDQHQGLLPASWDPDVFNIVLYNSSEDEFVAIGDQYENSLYADQAEGMRRIAADLGNDPNCQLYLRVHPNLRGVDNVSTDAIASLNRDELEVIPADGSASTYELIRRADLVITFGSSVGIEAAYWGTPSVLAGPSLYRDLGSCWLPRTHDELVQLCRGRPEPRSREGALRFGNYMSIYGYKFRYFVPGGVFSGRFLGERIRHRTFLMKQIISAEKRLPWMRNKLTQLMIQRRVSKISPGVMDPTD